jgi:hypothetical protein
MESPLTVLRDVRHGVFTIQQPLPNLVASPKSYPLWDRPILLHFLGQFDLNLEGLVRRLSKEAQHF